MYAHIYIYTFVNIYVYGYKSIQFLIFITLALH